MGFAHFFCWTRDAELEIRITYFKARNSEMNPDLLRLVDVIHRDKEIDKEIIFSGIEQCLLSAARKNLGNTDDVDVVINRESGEITISQDGVPLDPKMLGRISALTGKQVLIQPFTVAGRQVEGVEFDCVDCVLPGFA